ncbi:sugar ABC transporter substrate-binding protein [Alsobacter metallidurans]|uniref:Probable sugar-binding periplasmic protein n=1 Tax=Alsobacter metallidurans TaxID=340221 RepID=A0A917MJK3_9HYPH|nr:ABC transporter substrate-binding protein [Alsobacter metallidurans]GGH18360.1 sugar ABC transporter substrate-binding protein [Alsobacter metallidurans]
MTSKGARLAPHRTATNLVTLGAALAGVALWAAPAVAQANKAEVIHWWTSGGESAAVKVFAEQFAKAGGTWVDTAIAGGANARTAAINRTVGGTPPTMMQFNTGKQFDELVENDLLNDVDAIATEQKWKDKIPGPILAATTRNGKMFAVPVNIHGQNWLFYNTEVLKKVGAEEPKTWDDLIPILDKIKAAGLIPLAFSGQKTWERNLFNAVLIGQGGPELWQAVYGKKDPAAVKSAAFKNVAETYAKLRGYVDPGAPGRNWNDASALVIQGKAGFQVNGDWAKGEFIAAGQTAGKEYGCTILSKAGGGYVMGGDVFAFPKTKDPNQLKTQIMLAKLMLEPETQIAFNTKKGSIPVRTDVDVSSMDICAQKGAKMAADKAQQAPAMELLTPPSVTGAVEDVISSFWNTPAQSTDQFADKFAAALKQI